MAQQEYLPLKEAPGAFSSRPPDEWDADDVASWLDSLGIAFEVHYNGRRSSPDDWLYDAWHVRFRYRGHKLTLPRYGLGLGYGGKPPTAYQVLESIHDDLQYAGYEDMLLENYDEDEQERGKRAYREIERLDREYAALWAAVSQDQPAADVFTVLDEMNDGR